MTSIALTGRIPTAILMSGTGSNARKLLEYLLPDQSTPHYEMRLIVSDNPGSNYRKIADEYGVEGLLNDIYEFCGVPHPDRGLTPEDRKKLREPKRREQFDRSTDRILYRYGVQLLALAGYDWVIAPFLCRKYIVLNVHPGDLRVRDSSGRRRYIGLGWIPTAKAILAGERVVHSTTHLVTAELDGGPIARVSQGVPIDLPAGTAPKNILPAGVELRDVIRRQGRGNDSAFASTLLVTHSKQVQERLKEFGDWIEFPRTLNQVAGLMRSNRLGRDTSGKLLLDGGPVEDLFLQKDF
jgi:folate-dependent phosphoribosylglycinamide formyltransferase PurN